MSHALMDAMDYFLYDEGEAKLFFSRRFPPSFLVVCLLVAK